MDGWIDGWMQGGGSEVGVSCDKHCRVMEQEGEG